MLPHQGKALSEAAGIGAALKAPRFSRLPMFDTPDDAQEWEDMLLEAFRAEDLDHWLPKLEASPDIAFEVAVTSEEGLRHPQIVHNGDVISVDDPTHGEVRQVGPIGHFEATPIVVQRSTPALGDSWRTASPRPQTRRWARRAAPPVQRRHPGRIRLLLRDALRHDDARFAGGARHQAQGRQW